MSRKHEKVKALLLTVERLQEEGKTRKEIAKEMGFQSERVVKAQLYRGRRKYIYFYNHEHIQLKTGVAPLTLRHSV